MATNFNAVDAMGAGQTGGGASLLVSAREFFRQPSLVGSAFPASSYLVDALLDPVDWTQTKVVVEYGPGSGPFTRALLHRMPRDSHLVALDVSSHFTDHLRRTIDDPRLVAVTACARSADTILKHHGWGRADAIVTGIPFSTMTPQQGARILDASTRLLKPDGQLLAYQMRSAVAPMLAERFTTVTVSRVWRNIPPCHLYWAQNPVS